MRAIMTKDEFLVLADKYERGEASAEERALVDTFCQEVQVRQVLDEWGLSKQEAVRVRLIMRISRSVHAHDVAEKHHIRQRYARVWWSAAVVLMTLGAWSYYQWFYQPAPAVAYVTHTASLGERRTIKLPDGSKVVLNAGSTITYPKLLTGQKREINLLGEAFFEVAHDKRRPFIVTSHTLSTTALGTSFDIDAYDSLHVHVALMTGSVKVNTTGSEQAGVVLTPGESANYDLQSGSIQVETSDQKKWLAWKSNILYFEEASHQEVFRALERWYGVSVDMKNRPKEAWTYSGEFEQMTLELVLNTIQFSQHFRYVITPDKVTIEFTD